MKEQGPTCSVTIWNVENVPQFRNEVFMSLYDLSFRKSHMQDKLGREETEARQSVEGR